MEYGFNSSRCQVSLAGLRCNHFGMRTKQTSGAVHSALDEGITLFDTATGSGMTRK